MASFKGTLKRKHYMDTTEEQDTVTAFQEKLDKKYPSVKSQKVYLQKLLRHRGSQLPSNFYRGPASFLSTSALAKWNVRGLFVKNRMIPKGKFIALYLGDCY